MADFADSVGQMDAFFAFVDRLKALEREGWSADDAEKIAIDEANVKRYLDAGKEPIVDEDS